MTPGSSTTKGKQSRDTSSNVPKAKKRKSEVQDETREKKSCESSPGMEEEATDSTCEEEEDHFEFEENGKITLITSIEPVVSILKYGYHQHLKIIRTRLNVSFQIQ